MNNKVLVVDDEEGIRSLFVRSLAKQGYEVLATGRGNEALRITRDECPKVVILDIKLPEINGLEVLEKIREEGSRAKVIIVTGYPSLEVSKKAKDLGVDSVIPKPFSLTKIRRTIKKALLNYNRDQMLSVLSEKHQVCPWGQKSCLFCEKKDCLFIKEVQGAHCR